MNQVPIKVSHKDSWLCSVMVEAVQKLAMDLELKPHKILFCSIQLRFIENCSNARTLTCAWFPFKFQTLFDAIDTNKDGLISLEEWQYAIVNFHFCSGPDSPFSLLFGPIIDED